MSFADSPVDLLAKYVVPVISTVFILLYSMVTAFPLIAGTRGMSGRVGLVFKKVLGDMLNSFVTAPTTFVALRSGGFLFKAGYGQIPQAIPGRPPVLFARIRA